MKISPEKAVKNSRSIGTISLSLTLLFGGVAGAAFVHNRAQEHKAPALTNAKIKENVGKLPLAFEPNKGQTDAQVKFLARAKSYTAFLTSDEAVLRFGSQEQSLVHMKLQNANPAAKISAENLQAGKSNYLIGNDRSKWVTGIEHFGKVRYENVYPGIDLAYHGNQRDLEYDFVVKPGADPSQIKVAFNGERGMSLDANGNMVLTSASGESINHKPVVYQTINGVRTSIPGEYVMLAKNEMGFKLGDYDRTQPLVIDPLLTVEAYIGGAADDQGWGIAASTAGVYLTGASSSVSSYSSASPCANPSNPGGASSFPLTPCVAGSTPTAVTIYQPTNKGQHDAFVTQLSADGSTLIYSTYIGGSGDDIGRGIAVDTTGAAYITGYTSSTNFPSTVSGNALVGGISAFVVKLATNGQTLGYSEYYGGGSVTEAYSIALDSSNDAYIGGSSMGSLPNATGVNGTFGGGTSSDGFVAKFDPSGNATLATYLGGSGADQVNGVAVDSSGNVYAAGSTSSLNFPFKLTYSGAPSAPTTAGTYAFVASMNSGLSSMTYSNIFGSGSNGNVSCASGAVFTTQTACDSANSVYVTSNGLVVVGGVAGVPGGTPFTLSGSGTAVGTAANTAFVATLTASSGKGSKLTFVSNAGHVDVVTAVSGDADGQAYFVGADTTASPTAAIYGRLAGGNNATPGAVLTLDTLAGAANDVLNGVTVMPSRLTFMVGTDSGASGTLPAGLTNTAVTGSAPSTTSAKYGYINTGTSTPTTPGKTNSGGNDVLFMGIQFQDIILTTNPATTPPTITFTAPAGGSVPTTSQTITASMSDGSTCTLGAPSVSATVPANVFSVSQISGTQVYNVTLGAGASTATAGTTTATVTFTGTGCGDNAPTATLNFNVSSTLNATVQSGGKTTFNSTIGTGIGTSNVNIPITLSTSAGSVTYTFNVTGASTGFPTIGSCFGNAGATGTASVAPSTFNVQVLAACGSTATAGTYTANLAFSAPGVTTVTIPFTLNVSASGSTGSPVSVSPTTASFSFSSGSTASSQSSFTVSTTSSTAQSYTASIGAASTLSSGFSAVPSGALSILSGATGSVTSSSQSIIVVQANPTGLASGAYQAALNVSAGGVNTPITLNVYVGNSIVVTPTSISLSAPQGASAGNNTTTVSVVVFTNGATTQTAYKAPAISGLPSGAVTVTAGAGTAPGPTPPAGDCVVNSTTAANQSCTYTLTLNTSSVVAGTYTGTMTVAPDTSVSSPALTSGLPTMTEPVTLTVTQFQSVIAETNPASPGTPAPLPASGLAVSVIKGVSGTLNNTASSCSASSTPLSGAPSLNLVTNGGAAASFTITPGSSSSNGLGLEVSLGGGAYTASSQSTNLSTTPVPVSLCVSQSGSTVPVGTTNLSLNVKDSFGNTTSIPVVVTTSSAIAGEIGVLRKSTGNGLATMFFDANGNFQWDTADTYKQFGLDGDIPVAGDWNGTGTTTVGVFRNGTWILDLNNNGVWDGTGSGKDGVYMFGLPGDIPVVGDWNGDGRTKFGVFRCPASGSSGQCIFVLDYAGDKAFTSNAKVYSYGLPGDQPVIGRWNPSSPVDQIGVFRCPSSGTGGCFWVVNSTGTGSFSASDMVFFYGLPGDVPIVGDWFGSGTKRIGVWRNGTVVLNTSGTNSFGATDFVGSFGLPGDYPVIGTWSGGVITQ